MKIDRLKWALTIGVMVLGHFYELAEEAIHALCVWHIIGMTLCKFRNQPCEDDHHV